MKSIISITAMFAVFLLAGCKSDLYYQDYAVQSAREFVLEESPELDLEQRDFVRFTAPVLLYDPSMGIARAGKFLTRQPGQIGITWLIPGIDEAYMVVGYSDSRMMDWYPNRLIRRTFSVANRKYLSAVAAARGCVYSGFYNSLSVDTANFIRFVDPKIYTSTFTPNVIPGADTAAVAAFANSIEGKTQYAMMWPSPDSSGEVVVVFGYSDKDLGGWKPNSGGIYLLNELSSRLGAELTIEEIEQ